MAAAGQALEVNKDAVSSVQPSGNASLCGHYVQMTLMRNTDLDAQPRHSNNHVLTQMPIIRMPIITIFGNTHFSTSVSLLLSVQYAFDKVVWLSCCTVGYR